MSFSDIASYGVAAAILAFAIYMALADLKKMGDSGVIALYLRLQVAIVAVTVAALIGVLIVYHTLPHGRLSLIVLGVSVLSFYVSSSMHKRAFPRGRVPAQEDETISP